MSWVRYDDLEPNHPKVRALGILRPLAHDLAHRIRCHCSAQLTNGRFDAEDVRLEAAHLHLDAYRVAGKTVTAEQLTDLLVKVGLWDRIPDGFEVHDYLDFNPSRASVLEKRAKDSERKKHGLRADSTRKVDGFHEPSSSPGPAPSRPSESEPSVGYSGPRGTHRIPKDHPLENATREIYRIRGCGNPAVCHGDFIEKKLGSGESQSDWHAIERSWAQRHDPARALCRHAIADASLPDAIVQSFERSRAGRAAI